ncbi:hypothetical protein MLD38_020549 [Melastoma candidum]|uniref:Uncharacterized protein n=1 Tax=Melastoma candidum TaxID=119954 RepID=A0ACB9QGB4_9MYRT|nr:hypothetical protein MLD38_020549 [Melastoma candidum]
MSRSPSELARIGQQGFNLIDKHYGCRRYGAPPPPLLPIKEPSNILPWQQNLVYSPVEAPLVTEKVPALPQHLLYHNPGYPVTYYYKPEVPPNRHAAQMEGDAMENCKIIPMYKVSYATEYVTEYRWSN